MTTNSADGSASQKIDITITGASDDDFTTDEDHAIITCNVLAYDNDPDALDILSDSALDAGSARGRVTDYGVGTVTHNPTGNSSIW